MAIKVVDPLEMVEINKDHAEGKTEAARTLEFAFGDRKQVPRVEQPGAVIGDRQFLNAFHGAYILDGYRGVVAQHAKERCCFGGERGRAIVHQLNDAQGAIARAEW